MNALTELKHGFEGIWESLSEGWNHIRERAANALTPFRPSAKSDVPMRSSEGLFPFTAPTWALLAGEVFEDERQVVVRLEVPGLEARDLDLEVQDDVLVVRGEKRFEHEESEGRYRLREGNGQDKRAETPWRGSLAYRFRPTCRSRYMI